MLNSGKLCTEHKNYSYSKERVSHVCAQILSEKNTVSGGIFLLVLLTAAKDIFKANETITNYVVMSMFGIVIILAFASSRWILHGFECVTGFTLILSGRGMLFYFVIALALSPIILPLGLVALIIQYYKEKREYDKLIAATLVHRS